MRSLLCLFILCFSVALCLAQRQIDLDERWGFIKPCISTKAEIEKVLGKSIHEKSLGEDFEKSNLTGLGYEYKGAHIIVFYSSKENPGKERCSKDIGIGTVTNFEVHLSTFDEIQLSELKIDLKKYKKEASTSLRYIRTYRGNENLIVTEISRSNPKTETVLSILFDPNSEIYFQSFGSSFAKDTESFFDSYRTKKQNYERINQIVDNFYVFMRNSVRSHETICYIVVYFDKQLPLKEYRSLLNKLRDYVYIKRKYFLRAVPIIEGGMRDKSEIEFYFKYGKNRTSLNSTPKLLTSKPTNKLKNTN